jgi:uncharacterized protein (DUF427 family)
MPAQGIASYYSIETNGEAAKDLVWYYPEPLPEAQKVRSNLCFFDKKVDLEIDGERNLSARGRPFP